jgi:hypothetical protein
MDFSLKGARQGSNAGPRAWTSPDKLPQLFCSVTTSSSAAAAPALAPDRTGRIITATA